MDLLTEPHIIEPDFDDDLIELEFKTATFAMGDAQVDAQVDAQITEWLNDGWRIHDHMTCAPFVKIIFHREKETTES